MKTLYHFFKKLQEFVLKKNFIITKPLLVEIDLKYRYVGFTFKNNGLKIRTCHNF